MSGQWGKRHATRWLVVSLCLSFIIAIISVVCMVLGLSGLQAQGAGMCDEQHRQRMERLALGRWDDAPEDQHLNWYVCETKEPINITEWNESDKFDNSWYKVGCGWLDYDGANKICRTMNASLVSINNQAENRHVQKLCGHEACWIGLHENRENPGTEEWVWEDGTVMGKKPPWGIQWDTFTHWNEGQPGNDDGREEMVAFMNFWARLGMPDPHDDAGDCSRGPRRGPISSGKWFDLGKEFRIQYSICEKAESITNSCDVPSRGRLEMENVPDAVFKNFQGSCYYKLCALHNFEEATEACAALGSKLVSINSSKENEFVRALCGANTCRIGLSEPEHSEEWSWEDGTAIGHKFEWKGYVNWMDGEPNNWRGHDEDCAVMNIDDIGRSFMKAMLFSKIGPAAGLWSVVQIGLPVVLIIGACVASKLHVACFAQAICIVAGVASVGLTIEIFVWLVLASKADANWPGGSRTLLVFEAIFALVQVILCCCATAKSQELQWSTTVGWNSMGAREVEGSLNAGGQTLDQELREVDNIADVAEG